MCIMHHMHICKKGPTFHKDKGYAWIILALSFLSHAAHFGFSFGVVGNLTVVHKEHFNISLEDSGFIGAVHMCLLFVAGPPASILVKKFGCRLTAITGGLCMILGLSLMSVASETWQAFLFFGVLTGFGVSCCYVASSAVLALHFDRYQYLAFAIANFGGFSGVIFWPIISQYLLDNLGYSKAMGTMSAVHVIHVVVGALFFEPTKNSPEELSSSSKNEKGIENEAYVNQSDAMPETLTQSQVCEKGEGQPSSEKLESIETMFDESLKATSAGSMSLIQSFARLAKSYKIWCLLICGLIRCMSATSVYVLVNDIVLYKLGLEGSEIALGITIVGVMNAVGAVMVGLGSSFRFNRLILHFSCILLCGISAILIAFAHNKAIFYVTIAGFGLGQGAGISNLFAMVTQLCEPEQVTLLFGLELMSEGIGAISGPSLSGYVAHLTKQEYSLVFSGSLSILAACFLLPVLFERIWRKKDKVRSNDEIQDKDIFTVEDAVHQSK